MSLEKQAEFEESTTLFTSLRAADPYRIDDIDILSNILYVSEKRAELASLAQEYSKVERNRPEVCCLVGASFLIPSLLSPLPSSSYRGPSNPVREQRLTLPLPPLPSQAITTPSDETTKKQSSTSDERSSSTGGI